MAAPQWEWNSRNDDTAPRRREGPLGAAKSMHRPIKQASFRFKTAFRNPSAKPEEAFRTIAGMGQYTGTQATAIANFRGERFTKLLLILGD